MRRGRRMEKLLKKEVKKTTVYDEFGRKMRVVLNPYKDLTLASKSYDYDNFTTYTALKMHIFRIKMFGYQYPQPAFYVFYSTFNKDNERKMYLCVIDEEIAIRLLKNLDINTHLGLEDLCMLNYTFNTFIKIVKEKFPDVKIP
jgi:hypothetical protein